MKEATSAEKSRCMGWCGKFRKKISKVWRGIIGLLLCGCWYQWLVDGAKLEWSLKLDIECIVLPERLMWSGCFCCCWWWCWNCGCWWNCWCCGCGCACCRMIGNGPIGAWGMVTNPGGNATDAGSGWWCCYGCHVRIVLLLWLCRMRLLTRWWELHVGMMMMTMNRVL